MTTRSLCTYSDAAHLLWEWFKGSHFWSVHPCMGQCFSLSLQSPDFNSFIDPHGSRHVTFVNSIYLLALSGSSQSEACTCLRTVLLLIRRSVRRPMLPLTCTRWPCPVLRSAAGIYIKSLHLLLGSPRSRRELSGCCRFSPSMCNSKALRESSV